MEITSEAHAKSWDWLPQSWDLLPKSWDWLPTPASIPASPKVWRSLIPSWNSSKDTVDPGFDECLELP